MKRLKFYLFEYRPHDKMKKGLMEIKAYSKKEATEKALKRRKSAKYNKWSYEPNPIVRLLRRWRK